MRVEGGNTLKGPDPIALSKVPLSVTSGWYWTYHQAFEEMTSDKVQNKCWCQENNEKRNDTFQSKYLFFKLCFLIDMFSLLREVSATHLRSSCQEHKKIHKLFLAKSIKGDQFVYFDLEEFLNLWQDSCRGQRAVLQALLWGPTPSFLPLHPKAPNKPWSQHPLQEYIV